MRETLSAELGKKPGATENERAELYQKIVLESRLETNLIKAGE